jgi:hypothetical protein
VCTLPLGSFQDFVCTLVAPTMAALRSGSVYFNVHTVANPGGTLPLTPSPPLVLCVSHVSLFFTCVSECAIL